MLAVSLVIITVIPEQVILRLRLKIAIVKLVMLKLGLKQVVLLVQQDGAILLIVRHSLTVI